MECVDRLHEGQPGLQELLCGAYVTASAGDGSTELRQWICPNAARAHAQHPAPLEEAAKNFRELDE